MTNALRVLKLEIHSLFTRLQLAARTFFFILIEFQTSRVIRHQILLIRGFLCKPERYRGFVFALVSS